MSASLYLSRNPKMPSRLTPARTAGATPRHPSRRRRRTINRLLLLPLLAAITPTATISAVTPAGTIQTDNPGGTIAIVNAATASTGLTAITLKPGSSLALVGDGTSAWYQYGGTSIAVA